MVGYHLKKTGLSSGNFFMLTIPDFQETLGIQCTYKMTRHVFIPFFPTLGSKSVKTQPYFEYYFPEFLQQVKARNVKNQNKRKQIQVDK